MQKNKLLSMLGIAKRASALSMGHDAAVNSLFSKKAEAIVLACDVSQRAERDMRILAEKHGSGVCVFRADITMEEIFLACGYKAGILAVCNPEFSKKIISLINE